MAAQQTLLSSSASKLTDAIVARNSVVSSGSGFCDCGTRAITKRGCKSNISRFSEFRQKTW
jgi:hypothetical protein